MASKIRLLSREEEAELARSNKKVKNIHHVEYSGSPGETSLSHETHSPWNQSNASFKDKLVGEIPGAFAQAFDFTNDMDVEDDTDDEDVEVNSNRGRPRQVAVKLSKETKQYIKKPWTKAIIVKLVGRFVSFLYMQSRLNLLWKPTGRMDYVDLGYGFFLVRFFSKDDLGNVLKKGPWFILLEARGTLFQAIHSQRFIDCRVD